MPGIGAQVAALEAPTRPINLIDGEQIYATASGWGIVHPMNGPHAVRVDTLASHALGTAINEF